MGVDSGVIRPGEAKEAALDGPLLAEISTALVQLHRRFYGRGPTRAKSVAAQDVVTCVLEDILTTVERTLVAKDRRQLVIEVRSTFQGAMAHEFTAEIERLTGRRVASFTSGVDIDNEIATETFVLAPLDASGPDLAP